MKTKIILWLSVLVLICTMSASCESVSGNDAGAAESGIGFADIFKDALHRFRDRAASEHVVKEDSPYIDMERNEKGEHVLKLQERLQNLGYYDGRMTGKLDSETMKAMKLFEKRNGLKNDGLPSKEDQVVLYSESAVGKEPASTPVPEVTATPDPMESVYAQYGDLDYEDAATYPENHFDEKVAFSGKIGQVSGSRKDGFRLTVSTEGTGDVVYVYINRDPGYDILEEGNLTVYGRMMNTVTYTDANGQSITIPACLADYIVLQ
ncbi:MAG: peptidoglycan-binding domain-containing protein [Christensenellales bacterium]|jgi:peptidoglycan hydrolase-like protein with peptidoglycan-binding domain